MLPLSAGSVAAIPASWRRDLMPLAAPASGTAIGWIAWRPEGAVALIALLPLLWALQRTRTAAGLFWLGYFLAGSRDMVPVVARFFPGEPWAFGIALWIVDALVLAIPWWLLWPSDPTSPFGASARTLAAIVLLTAPPLGCLAWLSPLLAGGILYPGWAWIGVGCTVLLLGAFATVGHAIRVSNVALARRVTFAVTGLLAAAIAANVVFRPTVPPPGWVAIDTRFGRFPTEARVGFERQQELKRLAAEAIRAGASVVILPEEVAGTWRPAVDYWWQPIDELAARHGATVLVGADVPGAPEPFDESAVRFTDSLVMLGATRGRADARVPIPVSSWRPWSGKGALANLTGSGVIELHGTRAAVSICYEDFLAWPSFMTFAGSSKPQVLLSVANNWFGKDANVSWIQRQSVELWTRLFGTPLIRATNIGTT